MSERRLEVLPKEPQEPTPWEQLRRPFPPASVGKLPRPLKRDDQNKGKCDNNAYSADGHFCGGWHARSIHLDYVGHAAVTDRLLQVDPHWSWEPMAVDQFGSPQCDRDGNLWIKLTVAGHTRLGCGDGPNMKERIGDALRNAAMRFGVALDLWSREELESGHQESAQAGEPAESAYQTPQDGSRRVTQNHSTSATAPMSDARGRLLKAAQQIKPNMTVPNVARWMDAALQARGYDGDSDVDVDKLIGEWGVSG